MPTIGRASRRLPVDPWNPASPYANTPPSLPVIQTPWLLGVRADPVIGPLSTSPFAAGAVVPPVENTRALVPTSHGPFATVVVAVRGAGRASSVLKTPNTGLGVPLYRSTPRLSKVLAGLALVSFQLNQKKL